jgi:hypothetical protein
VFIKEGAEFISSNAFRTPSRALALLRSEGYAADILERRLPRCFISRDLFGMFDVVALRADLLGVLGVQTTSGSNHAHRVRKLVAVHGSTIWP